MSWTDYYRRRDAIDAVLDHARREPAPTLSSATLPFHQVPGVAEVFTGPDELLLALHHRWTLKLTGRVGLALAAAERDPRFDLVDGTAAAYREAAAENPVLRRLLDAHADHPALAAAVAAEHRMLAVSTELADLDDTADERSRVGAAFVALARAARPREVRRPTAVGQLLRRLMPTSA